MYTSQTAIENRLKGIHRRPACVPFSLRSQGYFGGVGKALRQAGTLRKAEVYSISSFHLHLCGTFFFPWFRTN
jgi:hypothetical protein